MSIKVAIVYYSQTGNTEKMANVIAEGANKIEGVECKAFSIDSVDESFVSESKCLILGTPAFMATVNTKARGWLETQSAKYNTHGKLAGAFATADYAYGGGEYAIRDMLGVMMVLGMMPYSGGVMLGEPYIHIGPVAIAKKLEKSNEIFNTYGQRMANKAKELFGN